MWLLLLAASSSLSLRPVSGLSPTAKSILFPKKKWRPHIDGTEKLQEKLELTRRPVDLLGVIDFECTCDVGWGYDHEIIEFPVVLVDASGIVGEFHSYVRPTENRTLTSFCTELTGIEQATVDAAPTLPEVLDHLDEWLEARDLVDNVTFALATDGWDLDHFLDRECKRKSILKEKYLESWVDLSKIFEERRRRDRYPRKTFKAMVVPKKRTSLKSMLSFYGMSFRGRLHCGLDDARNIARLANRMMKEGKEPLCVNDSLNLKRHVEKLQQQHQKPQSQRTKADTIAAAIKSAKEQRELLETQELQGEDDEGGGGEQHPPSPDLGDLVGGASASAPEKKDTLLATRPAAATEM